MHVIWWPAGLFAVGAVVFTLHHVLPRILRSDASIVNEVLKQKGIKNKSEVSPWFQDE